MSFYVSDRKFYFETDSKFSFDLTNSYVDKLNGTLAKNNWNDIAYENGEQKRARYPNKLIQLTASLTRQNTNELPTPSFINR